MQGIARRHQGLAGSVSYGYMNRYLFNFTFGYNGSENFAIRASIWILSAYSIAWNVAEESFVKDNIDWLSMFKIRYSDGKVGTDNTPTRFPILPPWKLYSETGAGEQEVYYNWGDLNSGFGYPGLTYTRVSSNNVTWEIARKHDLGFDLYLWGDKFGLTVDYFDEKREGIYMTRSYLPDMVGIQGENPAANVGSVKTKGFDGNFKFDQRVRCRFADTRKFYVQQKTNYQLMNGKPLSYLRRTGFRIDQAKDLIALGLLKIMKIF